MLPYPLCKQTELTRSSAHIRAAPPDDRLEETSTYLLPGILAGHAFCYELNTADYIFNFGRVL